MESTLIFLKSFAIFKELSTKLLNKYFVEIHYTLEENKPILEYIMTEYDINELLCKYDFGIKL